MPNGSARRERTRHSAVLDGGEDSFVFLKRQQHETLETGSTLDVLGEEDVAPRSLATLLSDVGPEDLGLAAAAAASPLELVAAVSTSSLRFASEAAELTSSEVLLASPCLWLHQQFAEELAIACSEYSAAALLVNPPPEEPRRLSKKQKQKLRRRKAEEALQAAAAEEAPKTPPRPASEDPLRFIGGTCPGISEDVASIRSDRSCGPATTRSDSVNSLRDFDDLPRSQLEVDEAQGIQPTLPARGSLAEGLAERFESFSDRPCLGKRTGDAYHWISYGRVYSAAKKISGALQSKLPPGSLVGICGVNSLNWFLADLAAVFAGVGSVPLSEDWDLAKLRPVVERCELSAVFCDGSQLPKYLALPSLRWIILLDGGEHAGESLEGSCHIVSMDSLAVAQPELPIKVRGPSDVHTILHTSGTTGLPKGVVYSDDLWQKNMVMYPGLNVGYSYMPLAYITDRHTVYTALWNGGRVGIRTPGSTDEIFRDLQALRPTVLKGVPAFWERVQRAARLVQDRSLHLLGGRCRVLICGAGALDAGVADWFRSCALDTGPVEFLEMYGGTECGNIAVNRRISKDIEYKVLPYEDMEPGCGELVVKTGSNMFSCYYKDPDRTAAAFTEDGFYKIGDLVRVEGDQIEVIGRAKSSIKLATGKWVFPESLEMAYRTELDAENVRHVFVHGDLHHDSLVAVVDAESKNLDARSFRKLDTQQLLQKLRSCRPAPLCAVLLAHEPFSQEARTLNGTGKLDRKCLLSIYGAAIEEELQRSAATAARASLGELDAAKSFKTRSGWKRGEEPLSRQGGTSLQAARIARLYLELGVPMTRAVQLLLSDEPLDHVRSQLEEVDAMADSKLGLPKPQARKCQEGLEYTLLTGGTGMIGRYILAELLERRRPVLCLVRAASEQQGRQRLAQALTQCGRYRPEWWPQLVVSTASLAKPLDLSRSVKDVIHAAAKVDLKAPYAAHRAANVLGTFNVLSYAATVGARVIFVSTTDVYKDKAQADACAVEPVEEVLKDARHGYAASKAVGEALVAQALCQGCPRIGRRSSGSSVQKASLRVHLDGDSAMLAADGNAREVLVAPPQETGHWPAMHPATSTKTRRPQDTGDQEPSRDKAQCRFCLETGGDDLIAPCMCKGHSKWVHRRCLDKWRSEGRGVRSFTHCPTCHFAYLMELKRAPTETEQHIRERRRAILRRAVGQFFLGAILVQVLLCLVAFLIRLCDPSSELVRLMPFFTPLLPDEDTRSYLDTFRFHKSTYYFASLVLSLATVGVVVSIMACCNLCKPSMVTDGPMQALQTQHPITTYYQMRACEDCCECCLRCQGRPCCDSCNDCPTPNLPTSSGGGGGDNNNSGGAVLGVILIAIVVLFALVGFFFAMAAFVTWMQKVWSRYLALKELRALTGEYIVKDPPTLRLPICIGLRRCHPRCSGASSKTCKQCMATTPSEPSRRKQLLTCA
eukprot:s275_g16.t6